VADDTSFEIEIEGGCVPDYYFFNFFFYNKVKSVFDLGYLRMKRKNQGTLLIVVGFFLSGVCPYNSLGNWWVEVVIFYPEIDLSGFWLMWLLRYGFLVIILAVIGIYFIVVGIRFRKWSRDDE